MNPSGMNIKWCKGCKNFRKWIDFGVKGYSSKCERCRQQQATRYANQKNKEGLPPGPTEISAPPPAPAAIPPPAAVHSPAPPVPIAVDPAVAAAAATAADIAAAAPTHEI